MRTLSPAALSTPRAQFTGPQQARVLRVTNGEMYVEIDAAPGLEVGPCAWSRPIDGIGDPPAGTSCLLLFADAGVTAPWLVTFNGWPA